MRSLALFVLLSSCVQAAPAMAQTKVQTPGGTAPGVSVGFGPKDGAWTAVSTATPLPVAGRQESFALATGNAASAAVTVYGGDYVFAQMATGYGTIKLQLLGPDGATWLDLVSKTASDATGAGTGLAIPNASQVRVTLTGTSGAYATLKRVP